MHLLRKSTTNFQPQSPTRDHDDVVGLVSVHSEELSKLQAIIAAEHQRNEDLVVANKQLEEKLSQALSNPNSFAQAQSQWAEEKAAWDAERAANAAALKSLTSSKESADTDCNFFREQYAQASAFVGSVRGENAELEQRAAVAEDQAKTGVAMIKATYDERVKALRGEIAQWRGLAEILQEKDRRTGDDIRKRAAEEPELRSQNAELRAEVERLSTIADELARDRMVLKTKIDTSWEQLHSQEILSHGTHLSSQEDDLVYQCLCRPGEDAPCLDIFHTPEVRTSFRWDINCRIDFHY